MSVCCKRGGSIPNMSKIVLHNYIMTIAESQWNPNELLLSSTFLWCYEYALQNSSYFWVEWNLNGINEGLSQGYLRLRFGELFFQAGLLLEFCGTKYFKDFPCFLLQSHHLANAIHFSWILRAPPSLFVPASFPYYPILQLFLGCFSEECTRDHETALFSLE